MFHVKLPDNVNISFSFHHERDVNVKIRSGKVVRDITACDFLVNGTPYEGLAACVSDDRFDKESGRRVALTRALEAAGLSKGQRTVVWGRYRGRKPAKSVQLPQYIVNEVKSGL